MKQMPTYYTREELGNLLREKREDQGLTIKELVAKYDEIGSTTTIVKIENGRSLSKESIQKYADFFDLGPVIDFFSFYDS